MVYYHPWDNAYKSPFGAVEVGTEVSFRVLAQNCDRVYLRTDDGGCFEMTKDGDHFRTILMPSKAGLVFYCFELVADNGIHYFMGKDTSGGCMFSKELPPLFQLTVYLPKRTLPAWYTNGIVYQIFPDRFCKEGDRREQKKDAVFYDDWYAIPHYRRKDGEIEKWDFFGGNLRGIIQKLPYLKSLHVTCIYLNPIFEANSNHRYNTADFSKIDPLLGSEEDYRELLQKAQELGIHILLDGVFNHTGADSLYFNKFGHYPTLGAYQSKESPYADWFTFQKYPDEYSAWWGVKDLPTVNKASQSYRSYMVTGENSIVKKWTGTGIGGWRLDVADELPTDFLKEISQTVKSVNPDAVVLGEVWEDASNKIAYGTLRPYFTENELDCVMNYPFRTDMLAFFGGEITALELFNRCMTQMENYPKQNYYANLNMTATHDVERTLTILKQRCGDKHYAYLKCLIALQFAFPGVPCIYYGDEAGLEGGKDPDNRRTYPWGRENQPILELYRAAANKRATLSVLQNGDTVFSALGSDVFGLKRTDGKQYYLLYINRGDTPYTLSNGSVVPPRGYMEDLGNEE